MNINLPHNNSTKYLFVIVTSILVFIICINPPVDPDMWWHLRSGQMMWQERTILTQDQFSFTRLGSPWVNAFWVSDLIIFLLFSIGGFPLLITMITCISVVLFLLIFLRSKGSFFLRSLIILLAAISISPQWTARPQVFSFFLLALLAIWMDKKKKGKGPPFFLLPIFFIAWANIHGGFIWGFLLLLATIIGFFLDHITHNTLATGLSGSELRQLVIWTVISFVAILINPNGLAIWKLPFYTIAVSISTIEEWLSPNFHNLVMQPFLWMIILLIMSYSLSEKKQSFAEIILVTGFIYMSFISQRNIPIAIIVITPILIERLSDFIFSINKKLIPSPIIESRSRMRIRVNWIINSGIISILLIFAILRVHLQFSSTLMENKYPVKAVEVIQYSLPNGKLFNSYNWGGYLIWNLPEYPVFIDGRADLYGKMIIDEWWDVVNGTDKALMILDKYDINIILLEPDWPIINILKSKQWNITYQDTISIIMVRE